MIVIDEQALEGKPLNQRDENNQKTGVWVLDFGFVKDFKTFKNDLLNGWRSDVRDGYSRLIFLENDVELIFLSICNKTHKIARKVIII